MNIADLRELKKVVENEIKERLLAFEAETGVPIREVSVGIDRYYGRLSNKNITHIEVKLALDI